MASAEALNTLQAETEVNVPVEPDLWTCEGDGFHAFTVKKSQADKWAKDGLKVTPYKKVQNG